MMHAKELRDLEDEIDDMKRLISQLQHAHEAKVFSYLLLFFILI